ncbi:DNA polymerase III subunit epsilon [Corynebacterium caspium DSM 44850]|nr:DNA polymerase III subunit epsilon [Corynebacterium caspium DSM 44850]
MLSFDLETTSVDTSTARIVTSALVRIDASGASPQELLADPGVEIPAEATAIHGISTEYARTHGKPHEEVLKATIDAIQQAWAEGLGLVVYNAAYDLSVLRALDPSFTVTGLVYDPYVIDKLKDRYRKGKRTLTDLAKHYNIKLENAHEATSDALASARIAWMQLRAYPDLGQMSGEELMEFQAVGYYEQQEDLKKYFAARGREVSDINTSWPMRG